MIVLSNMISPTPTAILYELSTFTVRVSTVLIQLPYASGWNDANC